MVLVQGMYRQITEHYIIIASLVFPRKVYYRQKGKGVSNMKYFIA